MKGLVDCLAELDSVTKGVGPRLADTGLVLLYWLLLSDFFADTCELTEAGEATNETCPA